MHPRPSRPRLALRLPLPPLPLPWPRCRHPDSRAQAAVDFVWILTGLWLLAVGSVAAALVWPGPWALEPLLTRGTVTALNAGVSVALTAATYCAWAWAPAYVRAQEAAGKALADLKLLHPADFEAWVAARFRERGYAVARTGTHGRGGDHGVDLVVARPGERAVVQCKKAVDRPVGEPVLRDLLGAMHAARADRAYLVTTGALTGPARRWVAALAGRPIEVWDAATVALLLPGGTREAGGGAGAISPPCPRCGAPTLVRRNGKTGEAFLGCSRWPDCSGSRPLAAR